MSDDPLVPAGQGRDERVVAADLTLAGGGPAATAAVTAARLGVAAAFVGTVGDDTAGRQVVEGLRAEGVDVSGVEVAPGARTGASVITVEQEHGTRTICTRPVPAPAPVPGSVGHRLLSRAAWVHADHLGWTTLAGLPPRAGRRVSLDAGNPVPGLDLAGVALYVPTLGGLYRDLRLDPSRTPVDAALAAAVAAGAGMVVATRGPEGSVATAGAGTVVVPAHRVDVVSTLGAGDVFHGALLAGVVRGMPLAEAAAYAGVVAALSCRGLDGRSAVPDHATAVAALAPVARTGMPTDDTTSRPTASTTGSRP